VAACNALLAFYLVDVRHAAPRLASPARNVFMPLSQVSEQSLRVD